jgi:hypothetical protein
MTYFWLECCTMADALDSRIVSLAEELTKLSTVNEHLQAVQVQIVVASDLYRGVMRASSDRNGLAAESLVRTLFEAVTNASILAKRRDGLKDFIRHGRFTELRMMRVIQVQALKDKLAPEIAATETEFQMLLAEFGDQRWNKMKTTASFAEAEFEVGMYDRYYRRASAIAHAQPYVTARGGKIEVRRAVWDRLSDGAAIMAHLLMGHLFAVVNRQFELSYEKRIVELGSAIDAIAKEDIHKIRRGIVDD